ncbi:hypothetical protein JVU11DRAFT_9077 [Chiua virens]|nr:hypothetical protein JVU11DRAFT_9077 [Chiua virens]
MVTKRAGDILQRSLSLFYSIWRIHGLAYAFVPGGVCLQESTDLVLSVQMAAMLLAFRLPFGGVSASPSPFLRIPSPTCTHLPAILCLFSLVSVLATPLHWPAVGPGPYKPGTRTINAGIWTVHFGIDNVGHDSQLYGGSGLYVNKDMELDVVGLLEDLYRTVYGNRDLLAVFLGYVVSKPLAPRRACLVYDIDHQDMDRWCEYVLYRGLYRTAYARVSRGIVTDTELQIGQFVVPKHGYVLMNQTEESRLIRSWKEDLPELHWFPMEYYDDEHEEGVNGHYYHVFNTPLYYQLPDGAIL